MTIHFNNTGKGIKLFQLRRLSDWYASKIRSWVNAFIFPMASRMSCRRDGVSLSDMNQIFFNERHVTGFDAFAGDEINFLVKEVF